MSTNDPLGGLGSIVGDLTGGGGAGSSALPAGLQEAIGGLLGGGQGGGSTGLEGLVAAFEQAGLGDKAKSWIGTGPNQSVSADEIAKALGPDKVQQLAGSSGIDAAQLLPMLAAFLPQIINALTPNGRLPQAGEPGAAGGPLDALGGLLKGLGG